MGPVTFLGDPRYQLVAGAPYRIRVEELIRRYLVDWWWVDKDEEVLHLTIHPLAIFFVIVVLASGLTLLQTIIR